MKIDPTTGVGTPAPDEVENTADPGADVLERFRYQAAYAAIISLSLLDDNSEFAELYCEQHEDVLVKRKDGKFVGVQIKTKTDGYGHLTANDEAVINSLCRFSRLDQEFLGHFANFVLCTSCGILQEGKNGSDLKYLIDQSRKIADGQLSAPDSHLKRYLAKIEKETKLTSAQIVQTLSRVRLIQPADMKNIDASVRETLASVGNNGELTYHVLQRMANVLVSMLLTASALSNTSPIRHYIQMLDDPAQANANYVITEKRITKEKVQEALFSAINIEPLYYSANRVPIHGCPPGFRLLERKMTEGGISAENIANARDQKVSAEILFQEWRHKYGPEKANKLYQSVKVVVGNECQEAFDSVFSETQPFGTAMLRVARHNLRSLYSNEPDQIHGLRYTHLLGVMGILTEECRLWWSGKFDIRETDNAEPV